MRRFGRVLAGVVAATSVSLAATLAAPPGISWAGCDRNMSHNEITNECKMPPPIAPWYTAPPAYAPSFAAQNVPPPPPPKPWWANSDPQWQAGFQQWGVYMNGVWVPL
jgi:hypothetical protein